MPWLVKATIGQKMLFPCYIEWHSHSVNSQTSVTTTVTDVDKSHCSYKLANAMYSIGQ